MTAAYAYPHSDSLLKYISFIFCSVVACLWPLDCLAENIYPEPQVIASILRSKGYKADVENLSKGGVVINSGSNGYKWEIDFYGCKDHLDCNSITFHSGFNTAGKISVKSIDSFNRDNRFVRTYTTEDNGVAIEFDAEMVGGIPRQTFDEVLKDWDIQLGQFVKYINF